MKTSLLTLSLIALLFSGCSKNDPAPAIELLNNGNVESGTSAPTSWFNRTPTSSIPVAWSTDVASSPTHSLKISQTAVINTSDFTYWGQTYTGNMPTGKDVTLSVKIKGVNLTGPGVSIVIRADGDVTPQLQFVSTQNTTTISGTFDWTTYTLKLPKLTSGVTYLIVYLVYLPNTTGTVYFDNASLTHY